MSAQAARSSLDRLVSEVLAGRGRALSDAQTLPAPCYTSPEFFQLEQDRIFRTDWLAVAHVAQIPNHGDYVSIDLLGEALLVLRDGAEVGVMSRVCLHKWVPIVEGHGRATRFACPFHRWTYDLRGSLVSAPFMYEAAGFTPAEWRLPQIRHEIVGGTIFVDLSGNAASLRPELKEWEEAV